MSANILFVDDDPDILIGYRRALKKDFTIDTAIGADEALPKLQNNGGYDVIVADMRMPKVNGIELLAQVEKLAPDTIRVMLTGNADQKTAKDAVNQGHIFRFLTKPCPPEEMVPALKAALAQRRLITAERELLEKTLNGSARMLSDILSTHDPIAFGQAQTMREHMIAIAKHLEVTQTWDLELAATLSQVGCVTVPQAVLQKARSGGPLSGPETDLMTRIPQIGFNLLSYIPRLETVSQIILYQNKNFDGSGSPSESVSGEAIPVGARILRVLHDLLAHGDGAAATSRALARMMKSPGLYDPRVLGAAAAVFDVCLTDAPAAPVEAREVGIAALRVGHVLAQDARTMDGVLIVPAGAAITPLLIERLRNFSKLEQLSEPLHVAG